MPNKQDIARIRMAVENLEEWVNAYIAIYDGNDSIGEEHPCYWAIERFVDLEADFPELCWQAITEIVEKKPVHRVLVNLAAGPLEELVELHGSEYIDRIEKQAKSNSDFRVLLRELWETTDETIWSRILRARTDD